MRYRSTRNPSILLNASEVIARGISEEGGLFVPEELPDLRGELSCMADLSYCALAKKLFSLFLTDFTEEEIAACVDRAYAPQKFGGHEPVRLIPLTGTGENKYLLELWHGPTCAFKDMALQILPYFLTAAMKKTAPGCKAVILTATSGDTGKAALEGFRDVPGVQIMVFYPQDGVSPMQRRQMVTQEGMNVQVCAVEGNFDDAQAGVKQIFTDSAVREHLKGRGMQFSSANSINWGRLLPQIVYYFYSYFELVRLGKVASLGAPVNVTVPTGNFGNILAAYYAREMGLPIGRLICASNSNNVLSDFIRTGIYDRKRQFYTTESPSMDILISSNLERLLFALSGGDTGRLSAWMEQLSTEGRYQVDSDVLQKVQGLFYGGFCTDKQTEAVIRGLLQQEGYLCDPHTAVAVDVYRQYRKDTGDSTPTIIASTASPYKFAMSVLRAVEAVGPDDEFQQISRLEELSHTCAPEQLKALREKPVRFTECVRQADMADFVLRMAGGA